MNRHAGADNERKDNLHGRRTCSACGVTLRNGVQGTRVQASPSHPLLQLQGLIGNRALNRSLGPQARLKIGAPGDRLEQEADRVADQVLREPASPCHCGGTCPHCRAKGVGRLQRKVHSAAMPQATPPGFVSESWLPAQGAQALPSGPREDMETRLGVDLEGVRIHQGEQASIRARALGARAYTLGRDIVFGAGEFQPHGDHGRRLLAHELVHVLQQSAAPGPALTHTPGPRIQRSLHIEEGDAQGAQLRAALARLTGRTVNLEGTQLSLSGEAGSGASSTMSGFIERAMSASRQYRLRSAERDASGDPVRGASWSRDGDNVVITLNPAHLAEFTWTLDELLSEQIARAVASVDPLSTPATAPPGEQSTMSVDEMLTRRLPYGSTDTSTPEEIRALLAQTMGLIIAFFTHHLQHLSAGQRMVAQREAIAANGVTLSEIVRGVETGTAFRTEQRIEGTQATVRYFDPRLGRARRSTFPVAVGSEIPGAVLPATGRDTPCTQAELSRSSRPLNSCCTAPMVEEIRAHLQTSREYSGRAISRMQSGARMQGALRRHFGAQGTQANLPRIIQNLRLIVSELFFNRHGWICRPRGNAALGCPSGLGGGTSVGEPNIKLCVWSGIGPPFMDSWKTVLHETVHATAVGSLASQRMASSGVETETYCTHNRAGTYPPASALQNADSYACFVRDIGAPDWSAEAPPLELSPELLAEAGMQLGEDIQPALGARLELSPLGPGLRVIDWRVGATYLWLPRYGVVPEGGTEPEDVTGRHLLAAETGARLNLGTGRVRGVFDLAAGAGALFPGGSEPDFALTGRGSAALQFGTPEFGGRVGVDLRGVWDTAQAARGGWILGLSGGISWGGGSEEE